VLSRTVSTSIGLLLLVSIEILVVSCDEVKHRDVLTFFFDGLEPPQPQGLENGPVDPNGGRAQADQAPLWHVHEPTKLCTNCHDARKRSRSTGRAYLIAQLPTLCYGCHDDFTALASFVHGPVAVGQCLFCHNPHKTRVKHLLLKAVPDLCYGCHDTDAIEAIPAHLVAQLSACTDCHNPHSGSVKALLKDAALRHDPELDRAGMLDKAVQDYAQRAKVRDQNEPPQQDEATQTAAVESESLFQVFRKVSKLVEQGQLRQARAYLDRFKDNDAFTDQERKEIAEVLSLMDRAAGAGQDVAEAEEEEPAKEKEPATAPEKDDPKLRKKIRENADLFYASMDLYREGKLAEAREGLARVLKSGLIPAPMAKTIRGYLLDLDKRLAEAATPPD